MFQNIVQHSPLYTETVTTYIHKKNIFVLRLGNYSDHRNKKI